MATIYHVPLFLSFRKPSLCYHLHQQPQLFVSSRKKHGFACSIKQTRVRKRVKSNEELRSEIIEFVALVGLPEGHVPSMKELSSHGRVDLANIVRRRGYKFISELVANSDMEDSNELVSEKLTNIQTSASEICLEDSNSSPETEARASFSKDESSLAGVSSMEDSFSNLGDTDHSEEITENSLKIESLELNNRIGIENSSSEASVSANNSLVFGDNTSSCPDIKADNALVTQGEEFNNVDHYTSPTYNHYTTPDLNYTKNVDIATESLSALTSENTMANAENFQNQQIDDMDENRSGNADDSLFESEDKGWMSGVSSSTSSIEEKTARFIQNGYLDTVYDDEKDIPNESCPEEAKESAETNNGREYKGDSHGGQRSVNTPPNGSALALEEVTHATEVNSSDSGQRDGSDDLDKDPDDETMKRENQVEITRLRIMLRQKELELSRLKEQIEKEKLSLSVLQRQAETEIQKAQMLISEKDVELQEAEENLSGLQEVVIEYCGDGNDVEVTGSFNGWQHRVGMELQASKSIGKQKCWSTLLWLYPGRYEIKFIVDGQWITDPQKDSVTRGHITNNILKVDSS